MSFEDAEWQHAILDDNGMKSAQVELFTQFFFSLSAQFPNFHLSNFVAQRRGQTRAFVGRLSACATEKADKNIMQARGILRALVVSSNSSNGFAPRLVRFPDKP